MARKFTFDPEDEEFFGSVGSFGVPKFDNEMRGGVPRGFTMIGFTETGSGSELFAKQFTSPAEEPENTLYIATCLLYTSPSPRDGLLSRMPSSA